MNSIVRRLIVPTALALAIATAGYTASRISSAQEARSADSNRIVDLGTIVVTPDNPRDREILAEKLMQEHRYTARTQLERRPEPRDSQTEEGARVVI